MYWRKSFFLMAFVVVLGQLPASLTNAATPPSVPNWTLQVVSWPLEKAYPGIEYNIRLGVIGGRYPYSYSLVDAPSGMSITSNKGEISWTPDTGLEGQSFNVNVKVVDQLSQEVYQNFTVDVTTNGFYFVATNGNNSTGDGSIGNPWATMNYAITQGTTSDILYVRGGTYVGSISISPGYINKWIAYPGELPVIDINQGSRAEIRDSYALIDGFEIKNASTKGFFVWDNVDHLIARRNHMHHLYDASDRGNPSFIFFVDAYSHDYNVIQDNLFHDLFDADNNHGASIICYNVRYSLYEDNEAYNFDGRCAADKDDGYYNTFRNNVFHGSGAGLTLSNQQTQEEIDVCYNLVYNTGTAIKIGGQPGYIRDIYVHHNTFTDSVTFRWVIAEPGSDEINVYNNIITNGDSWLYALEPDAEDAVLADDRVHVDDNLLWTTGSYVVGWSWGTTLRTFSEWQGYGKDLNGILDDPQLDGNYNLPPGSPYLGIYGRQIVTGPQPPGQASNPSPANSTTNISVDADLSWSVGSGATSHDVYFGTDSTPDAGEFQGNQTATTYDPGTMANSTTYYWRIDEINTEGTTTGNVWNFTTEAAAQPPGQASNPSPADSATGVSITADLSWTAGSGATSRDVYFGTSSPGTYQGNQTATTYDPGTMANDTTYYWRIDEINAQGTTTGIVWSFTTQSAGGGTILLVDFGGTAAENSFGLAGWNTVIKDTYTDYRAIGPGGTTIVVGTNGGYDYQGVTGSSRDFVADEKIVVTWYNNSGSQIIFTPKLSFTDSDRVGDGTGWYDMSQATVAAYGTSTSEFVLDAGSSGTYSLVNVNCNYSANQILICDKIELVTVAAPPGQATNPLPADSATNVSIDADLSWTAGTGATSRDVYFGTSSPGAFQGNQTDTTFEPGTLSYDVTYYWRIDEINTAGTTTGAVWSFTTEAAPTPPGQATNPSPADSATDVSIAADLSWTAGTNSTSSDVYFGTTSPGTFQGNQTAATFDPGTMANSTTYYWRIDEINIGGTTTGNVWSFTTAAVPTYECDNWQSLHPEWIFCDDFESTDPMVGTGRYFEYDDDSGDFVPIAGIGVDNSRAMRVIWQNAETGAGGLKLGFGRNPSGYMDKGIRNTEDFPEVYYRFYLKMQDGWQGNPAKLSRATVIAASDWSQAMIAHHWGNGQYYLAVDPVSCVDASSQVICIGYNDYANMEWLGAQTGTTPIFDSDNGDIWHYIEMHVKLNDPGQANGIQECWIDGVLDARRDNLDFVTSYTDYAINAVLLENYWDTGSVQLQERYFDSFVVSNQPIGQWTPGPQPPGQASNPSPADSAADVAVDADLSWTAGTGSTSSDVYFGTTSPGTFQGNQTATTFDPGTMANDTTYYWRIDEINAEGTTTGNVWSFTTIVAAPGQASSPSPADSAANVAVDADLSWTAGSSAASHDVYFGTSSPGTFQGNQAATTFDTGTMANDTTYYWRIDEINAGGTTTGTVWSFTTVVTLPAQASSPSPGTGASDIAVDTDLSWTTGSGTTSHDVYFGTSSPGTFQGNQAATTFEPGTMANDTTYYWRIDEVNAGGTTTGTVWSFTTIVAAPAQATNPSPANAAADVDINANLGWTAGSGAATHDVYFGTTSPGSFQGNQAATTFEPDTMAYDTTYYWRIDEINVGGTTTGTVWNFTTESAPLPPPGQASNPNPADSAVDVGVGADLNWTAGSGATSRDVYFGTSSPGAFQGNQTAVTFDPGTMDNDTTYYWRIDEINASGTTTGIVWSFTTVTAGGQVTEEFGDAANTDHPGTIEDTFANAGEGGSVNYSTNVILNTYTWPADTIANTTIIKWDLSSIPTDATVINATLYLYQVETGGDTSYDLPVHKIINVNPVISACTWNTYDGTNPWTGGADGGQSDIASAEDLQVVNATNNEYKTWSVTNMVADWVSTPSGNYGMLVNSDSVASVDSHRFFASTEVTDASTRPKLIVTYSAGVAPPGQASNPSPADSTADVSINADLSWTAGSGADSHDVYFGTSSPGTFQGNQAATTFDTGSMSNDTTYYWRIDEVNTAGTTTGTVWSFTTIVAAPGQASSPSPADSATDIGIDADLSWTAGTGATSSDVYFGTTSPGTFQGNQTATTFEPGTMANDTTYYWRIDEINVAATTTGVVWSFTTEAAPPPLPGQANNPSPADSATDVAVSADLSWTVGSDATSHDVYFGTTSPGTFQGNQTAVTFDPGTMSNDTTYYWRIDEVNVTGTTTGSVWSFTTIVSTGDEIIGWWEMDDAAGGTTVDSSAYGNDGTLVGVAWLDDAERSWCLDFSDVNNYVTIPNESDFDLTGPMTVMAWMKDDYVDWRNFSTITAKGRDGGGGWVLQKASRANAMSFYVDVSGMPWDGIKAGVGIFDNQWHHVAGVYDGSNAYIYIDGGLDSNSVACSGSMATNDWPVYIGENSKTLLDEGVNAREWQGLIDDVRVYNYALTQSEVNDIYTGGPTPPGQASSPSPADSATDVSIDADLSWTSGTDSTSSDVYFGTTSPGAFQGNQTASTFDPGTMSNDTTYYWRIDEINAAGTTTGTVWSFTTVAAPAGDVEIIGSWLSGTTHTAEAGNNRTLIFTAHVEDNNADMDLTSVTYGGQAMTKVVEQNVGSGYRAYVVAYILDEAGINAASGSDFIVNWAQTPSRSPGFSSVFLQNVNQTSPTAATDGNGTESSATLATSALSTNDGDMVVVAGACGNSGEYSVNNGFTEGIEIDIASADAVAGYKAATGASEAPSITHSNVNRQVVIGFVVQTQ